MATVHNRMVGADSLPQSSWSVIRSTSDPLSPARQDRMTHLLTLYWRPVYRFVRASWGKAPEDCRQLAQDYFVAALETDLIATHGLQNGGFRRFVKQSLVTFLVEKYADSGKPRARPPRDVIAFNPAEAESPSLALDQKRFKPEEVFDRQWAREIAARSLERMQRELRDDGNEIVYRAWEALEVHPTSPQAPTPEAASRILGLPVPELMSHHETAQGLLGELLVESVADYVATRPEASQELRDLFGG